MEGEIVIAEQPADLNTPTSRIKENAAMLGALAPIIRERHTVQQNGETYVRYAGGAAIAAALGYTITTLPPVFIESPEGAFYECVARLQDGEKVIAEAVGYLGMDEPRWAKEPIYSRRSMAQTRAGARLCRQNFAHLYVAIGASDTAYEELPRKQIGTVPDRPIDEPEGMLAGTARGVPEIVKTNAGRSGEAIVARVGDVEIWVNDKPMQKLALDAAERSIEIEMQWKKSGKWNSCVKDGAKYADIPF